MNERKKRLVDIAMGHRAEHAEGIEKLKNISEYGYALGYDVNKVIEKQNQMIDDLNALFVYTKFEKALADVANVMGSRAEERTLWVNEDYEVVKFCCDELRHEFTPHYVIVSHTNKTNTKIFLLRYGPNLICQTDYKHCPYCNASIALEKKKEKRVCILLTEQDAKTLRYVLSEEQKKAIYDTDNKLYERLIIAIDNKEKTE